MARATTTADLLRDADTDDRDGYGDETETSGPAIYERMPVSIIERTQRAPDPTTGTLVAVTALVGRCSGWRDVRAGDRLVDNRDGVTYGVRQVSLPQNPARTLDLRMELVRI